MCKRGSHIFKRKPPISEEIYRFKPASYLIVIRRWQKELYLWLIISAKVTTVLYKERTGNYPLQSFHTGMATIGVKARHRPKNTK